MTQPTVTIAVPALNEELHIGACLDAIEAQTYPHIIQVIVVDGGSDDRTREVAARPGVRVVDNPRRIQAAGLNIALEAAKGDVLVRVDGHCLIAPDYVERCVDALCRTGAAMVGGAMRARVGGTSMQRAIAAAMSSPLAVGPARFHAGGNAGWVDTVYLGAFRSEVGQEVGGYAEDVGVNEDAELAIRLRARGGVWFEPSIRSSYVPRDSLHEIARQFRRYGWSRAQTVVRHPTSMRPRQIAPLALVALLLPSRTRSAVAAAYIGTLMFAGARQDLHRPLDVLRFGAVAGTMHFSWAFGFVAGTRSALTKRA